MAKILVVDDQRVMRSMFQKMLVSESYEVDLCEDGEEAYKAAMKNHYDLILTDLIMPKMDGIELTLALRETKQYKFTPILIVSNNDSPKNKAKGKDAGATGWVVKPVKADQMIPHMHYLLRDL